MTPLLLYNKHFASYYYKHKLKKCRIIDIFVKFAIVDYMNNDNPFGSMPTHEAFFKKHGTRHEYGKKERFIHTDTVKRYMYFIEEGYVKVSWTLATGDERLIVILPGGISLRQQHSIYDNGANLFDVTTLTPSVIWRIPEELFFKQMNTDITFANELALQGFRSKDYLIDQLTCLGEPTIYRRMLRWVLLMAHWYGMPSDAGIAIKIPLTQETIGGFLHASRASINPLIGTLTEKGFIRFDKKYMTALDIEGIKRELSN